MTPIVMSLSKANISSDKLIITRKWFNKESKMMSHSSGMFLTLSIRIFSIVSSQFLVLIPNRSMSTLQKIRILSRLTLLPEEKALDSPIEISN